MTNWDVISSQIGWSLYSVRNEVRKMTLVANADIEKVFSGIRTTTTQTVLASRDGECQNVEFEAPSYSNFAVQLTVPFPRNAPPTRRPTSSPKVAAPSESAPASFGNDGESGSGDSGDENYLPSDDTAGAPPYQFCPDQIVSLNNKDDCFGMQDSGQHFTTVELVSAATAFAINFGIIDSDSLIVVGGGQKEFNQTVVRYLEYVHGTFLFRLPPTLRLSQLTTPILPSLRRLPRHETRHLLGPL